jgi:4-oxalocrotonate tautomerase
LADGEIISRQTEKRRDPMPYINLKLLGQLTKDQKAQIVKEFSETLERVADKPSDHTYIVIDEVERENWGKGGILFSDM